MIPALLLLPASILGQGDLDDLAALVAELGVDRTVLVGAQRDPAGHVLDEFAVAAALASRPSGSLGVAARVGSGRAASIVAREATATQLLGCCDVLLLDGDPPRCRDAAEVIEALLAGGSHTVTTPTEHVESARNYPVPDAAGGVAVLWRDGEALVRRDGAEAVVCGSVVIATPSALPRPAGGELVVLDVAPGAPASLASALAR